MSVNSFGARSSLDVNGTSYEIFRLDAVEGSAKLPFGTLVWCSDDAVAACLLPTETAKPLAEVGLLDLSSAECTTIIEHAVGEAEGFEIYDVRANSAGVMSQCPVADQTVDDLPLPGSL